MFSGLRQSSLFYILEKSERPTLRVGQVQTVSNPVPKYGTFNPQQPFGAGVETTVDISVKVGDEVVDFKQLPSQLSIANFGPNGVVVSESREAMLAEVESMLATSRNIIDSVPYHEGVISSCDEMLAQLNPQFAKDREQEKKIVLLENKVTGMENTLGTIHSMLTEVLNKPTGGRKAAARDE